MKILLLTTSFPTSHNPVSGLFIEHLITHFCENIDLTIITPADRGQAGVFYTKNYCIIRFAYAPSQWRILAHSPGGLTESISRNKLSLLLLPFLFIAEFITVLKWAGKADLIHANWSFNGVIACLVGVVRKIPVVTTLRGSDVNSAERSFVFKLLIAICFRFGDAIITVSESLRSKLIQLFSSSDKTIHVIENGITDAFFQLPAKSHKKKNGSSFLMVGNLTKNKGVHLLLDALCRLPEVSNVKVDIVGDGPEKNNLERMTEKRGLSSVVRFQGSIEPSNIVSFYKSADVFVFTSFSEGRPNVVLEAMASGLAIIASDIGSIRELIEDKREGLLFKTGDSDDLAKKINMLVGDPEMIIRLGENARKMILNRKLTWKTAAAKYQMLYHDILKQREDLSI